PAGPAGHVADILQVPGKPVFYRDSRGRFDARGVADLPGSGGPGHDSPLPCGSRGRARPPPPRPPQDLLTPPVPARLLGPPSSAAMILICRFCSSVRFTLT